MKTHLAMAAFVMAIGTPWAHATTMFTSSDDTYAQRNDNSANGAEAVISVKRRTPADSTIRVGYVQFDLTAMSEAVSGASLTLSRVDTATGDWTFNVYGINDGADDEHFDESTAIFSDFTTFNTSFSTGFDGLAADDVTNVVTALGTFTISDGEDLVVSGTALDTFLSSTTTNFGGTGSNTLATFAIVRDTISSSVISQFASKESSVASAPTLITAQDETPAVPEPMTAGLAAIGALGLLGRRRR